MRVNAATSLAKGKFATVKPLRFPLLLENIGEILHLQWRTECQPPKQPEIHEPRSQLTRVQIESLKEMARLGYVRGFRELLDKHISANQISKAEGEKICRVAEALSIQRDSRES